MVFFRAAHARHFCSRFVHFLPSRAPAADFSLPLLACCAFRWHHHDAVSSFFLTALPRSIATAPHSFATPPAGHAVVIVYAL